MKKERIITIKFVKRNENINYKQFGRICDS